MTLDWLTQHPHLRETDDGRYRIRKSVTQDRVWQYRPYRVGQGGREECLGIYASCAEAEARCVFHAGPTELANGAQDVTRCGAR